MPSSRSPFFLVHHCIVHYHVNLSDLSAFFYCSCLWKPVESFSFIFQPSEKWKKNQPIIPHYWQASDKLFLSVFFCCCCSCLLFRLSQPSLSCSSMEFFIIFSERFSFFLYEFFPLFRGCFMKHELKSYPKHTRTLWIEWMKKRNKKKIFIVEIGFCWTLCTKIFFCLPLHPINFLFSPTRCDVFCGGLRFMIFKPLTVHWHMWNAHWTLIFHVSMWE